jgi:DNA modification methylase
VSVRILVGEMQERLKDLPDDSVDSCVCDPPYHLTSIIKRFSKCGGATRQLPKKHHQYHRLSKGFMGQTWDGGDVAFRPETWAEVLRVLKPGGHLIAFSGTRTYHRMAVAIEDAGFEIRDQLAWVFGSGFPKSKDLGDGWGTALKPAWEPICLARKPLIGTNAKNMAEYGVGGLNIDGCRVHADDAQGGEYEVKRLKPGATLNKTGGNWRPEADDAVRFKGEMKPGRWPANLIHDGSDEVVAGFPDAPSQLIDASTNSDQIKTQNVYGAMKRGNGREGEASAERRYADEGVTNFAALPGARRGDSGSAARFFYAAKTSQEERGEDNNHPTVKPVELMRWLVRLVTPKNGLVLDPFLGSGSTALACDMEQFDCIGCELSPDYAKIAERRIRNAAGMFAQVNIE